MRSTRLTHLASNSSSKVSFTWRQLTLAKTRGMQTLGLELSIFDMLFPRPDSFGPARQIPPAKLPIEMTFQNDLRSDLRVKIASKIPLNITFKVTLRLPFKFTFSKLPFKVPLKIIVKNDLPKNAMGKIQKNLLRSELKATKSPCVW